MRPFQNTIGETAGLEEYRDMKTRLISAAVLLPVLFLVIWILPKLVAAILIGLVAAVTAYELLYRTGYVRHVRLVAYCVCAAFLMSIWSYFI